MSRTFKNHAQFVCNSHNTEMSAHLTSLGNMRAHSKTTKNKWHLMRTNLKYKLQNSLHTPARHGKSAVS